MDEAQRVEDGKLLESLTQHEGWAVLERYAEVMLHRDGRQLAEEAKKVAISSDLQDRIDYARRLGYSEGISFFRDVVETGIASAKKAAADIRGRAETAAAEGTNS